MSLERFVCTAAMMENRNLSPEVWASLGIQTPEDLHLRPETLTRAAEAGREAGWVFLPFCNTLCAEALGAEPTLSMDGARVRTPPYNRVEDLPQAPGPDTPRMSAMWEAMDQLRDAGERVAYEIEGPFTLLSTLLPMGRMFAALRKPAGQDLLRRAEDWVCAYAKEAVRHGAQLLSYSDAVATVEVLGEKTYRAQFLPCFKSALGRLRRELPEVPLHLCGKTTQSLLDTDSVRCVRWEPQEPCVTYGDALNAWFGAGDYDGLPGQYCLNLLRAKRPWLTLLYFEEET